VSPSPTPAALKSPLVRRQTSALQQQSAPPPAAAAAAAAAAVQRPLSRAEQLARLRAANQRLKEAQQQEQEESAAAAASPPPSQPLAGRPKRSFFSLLTRSPTTPQWQAAASGGPRKSLFASGDRRGLFSLSPSPQRGGGGGGTPLFSPMSPLLPVSPGQRLMIGVSEFLRKAAAPLTIFRRLYGRTPSPTRRPPALTAALLSPDGLGAADGPGVDGEDLEEAEERCGGACAPRGSAGRPRPAYRPVAAGGRLRPNPTLFDILMGSVATAPSVMRQLPAAAAAPATGAPPRRGGRASSMPTLAEGGPRPAVSAAGAAAAAPHGALAGGNPFPASPIAVAAARHPLRQLLLGQ
jgi:hypothetical protein